MGARQLRAITPSILAVTLLAFAARAFGLAEYGLNGDEAFGARLVYRGWGEIVAATTSGDPHPPLYYALLKLWVGLVGDGELQLRFIGLAAGVLLVPATYRLGRWLFPAPVALLAALILAVHPYQVYYSHQARMYLPFALLATGSVALLVRWLSRPAPATLAGYVVVTALALYSHYYASLLVLFENLFVLALWAGPRLRREAAAADVRLGQWAVGQLLAALCFAPWLVVARKMVREYNALGWAGPGAVVSEALARYSVGQTLDWPGALGLGLAYVALGALGVWVALRGRPWLLPADPAAGRPLPSGAWLVLGWALFPLTVGILASFSRPMIVARYLMVSSAAFALALALGIGVLWRWKRLLGALAVAGLLGVSGRSLANLYFEPAYALSGYDKLAEYIVAHERPGDGIIVAGWTQQDMYWYYYERKLGGKLAVTILPSADPLDPVQTMREVEEFLAEHDGVWFLATDTLRYDPQRVIERQLATHHYKLLEKWFYGNRLAYYASGAERRDVARKPLARFGDEVELVGATLPSATVRPGEPVLVGLLWEAARPLQANYKVSVTLKDPDGHVVAAVDREPADAFVRTSSWEPGQPVRDLSGLIVPTTALPGEHSVVVKLYAPETGLGLAVRDAAGEQHPDGLPIGKVSVAGPPSPSVADAAPGVATVPGDAPLRLLGYDPPPDVEFSPGQPVGLRLYWQSTAPVEDQRLRFELVAEAGSSGGSAALAPAWYPVSRWEVGRTYGVYTELVVPPRTPTGRFRLRLSLEGGSAGAAVDTAWVFVRAPERRFEPPTPGHAVGARFGGIARLVGYDAPGTALRPGDRLEVVLHWEAVGESDVSYKVFAHLVGPDGKLHGQSDAPPQAGRRPTTGWVRGEHIADPLAVPLAADAPAGAYVLKVGLYEESSGRRVLLEGAEGDSVDVLRFAVSPR